MNSNGLITPAMTVDTLVFFERLTTAREITR